LREREENPQIICTLAEPKHHEIVIKTHIEFIKSGSQVITTNSYATQPNYYMSAYEKDDYMKIMCKHAKVGENRYVIWVIVN
jgi:S-methylmethionine-dependent homocysteine/selenocysteine methylase